MEFQLHGRRFLVTWQHIDDNKASLTVSGTDESPIIEERETVADLLTKLREYPEADQRERGVPRSRRAHYDGLTICRIRTLKDDADNLPPAERWQEVAEGYSFKRASDVGFNKKISRKHSLRHALKSVTQFGRFSESDRETIWAEFLKVWPTTDPGASAAEKTIARLRVQLKAAENHTLELMAKLKEAKGREE
jgi:hypothetical protein